MSRKKKYIPARKYNPVVQAKRLEELSNGLDKMKNVLDSVINIYEKHIEYLSNFAGHNMGNAIQSMYATLLVHNENQELNGELKSSVDNLNSILDSFKQIITCTHAKEFTLKDIMVALETLTRSSCTMHKVNVSYKYDKTDSKKIELPFQSLLQVLHNLVSNAIKALVNVTDKRVEVVSYLTDTEVIFSIKDNGCGISDDILPRIFDYQYTTTENGTGIGLFHAKYIIQEQLHGVINTNRNVDGFVTVFTLKIPL